MVAMWLLQRMCATITVGSKYPKIMKLFMKIGAGEGIRTLDPDLGKVVLYP